MITTSDFPQYFNYSDKIIIGSSELLDKTIMRYTSERTFNDIANGKFFVRQRASFNDERERGIYQDGGKAFRLILSGEDIPQHTIQIDNKIESSYNLYTSCWTKSNQEDVLMWKAYDADILIRTTVKEFLDSINMDNIRLIICDEIKYHKEQWKSTNLSKELFWKVEAYCNEEEIRFYIDFNYNSNDTNSYLLLKKGFVNTIMFSPLKYKKSKDDIIKLYNIPPQRIIKSEIIENSLR